MPTGKLASVLAVTLLTGCSFERHVSNPFPEATELRLFVETGYDRQSGRPVFHRSDGVRLKAEQRKTFEKAIRFEDAPGEMAACFIPHHFFRYFDSHGKQVGELAVCFCCNGVTASGSPKLRAGEGEVLAADYPAVERIV